MVPSLPFLSLVGRAQLALADACGGLELPQLIVVKLSFPSVCALEPNPAVLMLLSCRRQGVVALGLGGLLKSWH